MEILLAAVRPVANEAARLAREVRYADTNGIADIRIGSAAAGHVGGLGPVVGMSSPIAPVVMQERAGRWLRPGSMAGSSRVAS
jgi:hypothetical protein